jgi:high affinity Mn2+ porin
MALLACLFLPVLSQAQDTDQKPKSENASVFPHSDTSRWWVSGQINVIFQAHPDFRALYSGPNSLHAQGENATSRVLTLYTGYELSKNFEGLLDIESAGGRGISDALGLAGFTNLDVVRNPTLGAKPYLARAMLHKVFALSSEETDAERAPTSLLTRLPARRIEIRAGKMSLPDYFDVNGPGSDSHLQFLNWTADNNGSYDYAADTRGYTVGIVAEYQDRNWGFRFADALMPRVANGPKLEWNITRAHAENFELELRPELLEKKKTILRLLSFVNHANMGSYREAIQAFLAGIDPQPDVTAHRKQGRVKYGFGFNFEQELAADVRGFGRIGWQEGQNESFAYTEVNQSFEFGADWTPKKFNRDGDKLGLVFMSNAITRDHQLYLALGGNGFLLGDGRLTYAREDILESYYTLRLWHGVYFSPDLQYITHPGYNKDRGPVIVPGLRLHLEL